MVGPVIHDRATGETYEEKVFQNRWTRFLYSTALGGVCVMALRLPVVSAAYGLAQRTRRSRAKIPALIQEYGIDMSGCDETYDSFNDFIARKKPTRVDPDPRHLISPADSCLLAHRIEDGTIFSIKGRDYTLASFLRDEELAAAYEGGSFLVFRLRVYDYHRFCFIDDGRVLAHKRVHGFLDSVNSTATGRFTLTSNHRELWKLQTQNFGEVVVGEVGAMLVGQIVTTHRGARFQKGEEQGYFQFGGSTIVLVLKPDAAHLDDDILAHSAQGVETRVRLGEKIGTRDA